MLKWFRPVSFGAVSVHVCGLLALRAAVDRRLRRLQRARVRHTGAGARVRAARTRQPRQLCASPHQTRPHETTPLETPSDTQIRSDQIDLPTDTVAFISDECTRICILFSIRSCEGIAVPENGMAFMTGSWDNTLKLWLASSA